MSNVELDSLQRYEFLLFWYFGTMIETKVHIQYIHLGFEPESLGLGMLMMILFLLNTIRVLPNVVVFY